MQRGLRNLGIVLGAVAFVWTGPASAHVCNIDLSYPAAASTCGDAEEGVVTYTPTQSHDGTVSITDSQFTRYGWRAGTNATLGNSHELDGGNFFIFHLDRLSRVTITVAPAGGDPLDAAFSLYRGTLPEDGHDDAAYDPLNPVDETTFLPTASPTDAAPTPDWVYHAHDGFRDTESYTTTGGLDADGNPVSPFVGQFDALGSWSMANEDAVPGDPSTAPDNWAQIFYILSVNGKRSGRAEVIRDLTLPAGDYTIAAGGANCNDDTPACVTPLQSATVSVRIDSIRRPRRCGSLDDDRPQAGDNHGHH